MVNLTNPMQEVNMVTIIIIIIIILIIIIIMKVNMVTSPMLWSRPVPLGEFDADE